MSTPLRPAALFLFASTLYPAFGQSGSVDASFVPPAFAASEGIKGVLLNPDGSMLVYGNLTSTSPNQVGLIRLLSNGQLDPDFQPELPPLSDVSACIRLASGGLLVSTWPAGLVRLDEEGHADPTLAPTEPLPALVMSLAEQADGKILLGGSFWWTGGYRRIMRINPDGSVDYTFYSSSGPEGLTGWVASIDFQPDGKILFGGGMSGVQGAPSAGLCRLNTDGTQDLAFGLSPGVESLGYGASLNQLTVLPDGKILSAGNFHMMNGVARQNMARLNSDGTLDTSFDIGTGFTAPGPPSNNYNSMVGSFAVQADGRILVAGNFTAFNGTACGPMVRLNSDGTLDPSFTLAPVFQQSVSRIALQPDGKVIAVGQFNGTGSYINLVRLENCFDGATCDDGLAWTSGDEMDAECACAGTPICAPSQLTPTADPLVSCGATGLRLDGTSTLYATPVEGANKYQFRFTNVPGQPAYVRNIASDSRALTLYKWATLPLKKGRSYNVSVRSSFDNGASYCNAGGSCTIAIANYPDQIRSFSAMDLEDALIAVEVSVYPDPYHSGPLMLRVSGFDPLEPLHTRILNTTGQVMMAAQLPLADGDATLSLPMETAMAPGLYFVELTNGGERLVQRLVVE